MAGEQIRIPITQTYTCRRFVLEIEVVLDVKTRPESFARLPFLFDTGTHLTTIPIPLARPLGIPFTQDRPARIRGAVGSALGFLAPFTYAWPGLPRLEFEGLCCFTTHDLARPLLSLTDVLRDFRLRTVAPSRQHPLGSLVLRLKKGHGGRSRPTGG